MAVSEQVHEALVVEQDELDLLREEAAAHGVVVEELAGPDGFVAETVAVTVLLLGAATAVGAVVHLLERRRGGQVFDLRPGAPTPIYRSRDLQFGLVAVLKTDGTVSVEVHEPKGMFGVVVEALAGQLAALATQDAPTAAATAARLVGAAGSVGVRSAPA